ncbi:MFS transporter [Microbispora sp. ATCC PTA-5024]|uniref:MFS transporter n=1 Tax=Microbispora sp. ATCC PTA-5024 TaxID=316330 RepID=UPI0007C6DB85|nr:MFS transporter [Microbispora sp. ATCC PTA-5024]
MSSSTPVARHAAGDLRSAATRGAAGVGARREALTLVAMCLGTMMTFLQITASVSALSALQSALHATPTQVVWIPSSYTLLVAALILSAGTLGNRYGRRRLFRAGVLVMAAGSLLAVAAGSTGGLIAAQAISGAGGALILPNSLALLGATFTDPHRRTEVVTAWAASSGIGLAVGPLLAGVLLEHYSWHAVFLSNPVLAVAALLATPAVAESRAPAAGRLDVAGLLLGTVTIAALIYALIQGGHDGYSSGPIVVLWAVAAVAAVAFVLAERRAAAPMLDIRLFRSGSFSAVMAVAAVSLFGFTGVALMMVLFYQRVQNLSALATGWRLLVMFGVYVVVASLAGRVIRRTGFKLPLALGLVIGGLACLGLAAQRPDSAFTHAWPLLAAFGAGCGLMAAPSTAAALVSVPAQSAGMASGAVNTFRQVGSVMGSSILGTLLTAGLASALPGRLAAHGVPPAAREEVVAAVASGRSGGAPQPAAVRDAVADAFTSGFHTSMVVCGVVLLVAAVLALAAVHNRPHQRPAAS